MRDENRLDRRACYAGVSSGVTCPSISRSASRSTAAKLWAGAKWAYPRKGVVGLDRVLPTGSDVLDEIFAFVRRFVGLTMEQATVVAL